MLGAIIGDVIGSRFEFGGAKSKDFDLFDDQTTFTDDTVMTVAVADCILDGGDSPAHFFRKWGHRYPDRGYGGMFARWILTEDMGPYDSFGNGAAMRIAPVALFASDMADAAFMAVKMTEVTHNHPDGIKGALATVSSIMLARRGVSVMAIRERIELDYGYDMNRTVDSIRPSYEFNVTCQGSVPEAIICALEASSYEDAIRNAISLGGDCDTQACIAGGIAEALFGIPDDIVHRALSYLPDDMRQIVHDSYSYCSSQSTFDPDLLFGSRSVD